ncbi:MAG: hypothetical protein M1817_002724 [Caeruleum heppii]|nr:MAG: hypothetical protein M1817_002724 [Caeruleum heppii]
MSTHERPRAPPAPRKTCAWCDCDHCRDQGKLIQEAVFRLYHLDADLRRGVNGPPLQVPVLDVTQVGKPQALRWMIETLQTDQIVIQDVLTSRPQPPPSSHKRVRSDSPWEAPNRSMGEPNGPPATNDDRRRSNAGGSCPPQKVPTTGPAQSRGMLPSPSSLSLSTSVAPNTLPPISPASSQASQSVQAAHFQDLQHQVSTKTLALQTLQQEHDSLLSAFSRAQSRCATLDKKSSVSDSEINNLTDERLKLQHQVLTLEAQVEELVQSRDEARKQSVANGGQYMQIMSMASRLEAQGTADKKLWKAEKEEWEKEKAGLAKRIAQLEKDKEEAVKLTLWPESKYYVSGTPPTLANESKAYQDEVEAAAHGREREREQNSSARSSLSHSTRRDSSPSHSSSCRPAPSHRVPVLSTNASYSSSEHTTANGTTATGPTTTADSSINLSTASPDALRTEIHRLRKSCHAMDVSLHDLKSEGHRINGLMQKFANIGRRITFQADRGVRAAQRVDENLGEDVKELVGGLRAGDGVTAGAEEGLAGLA